MRQLINRIDTALAHLAGGDPVRAETLIREVLASRPDYAPAWHGLACIARAVSQPRVAIASVAKAISLATDDADKGLFHLTLAFALLEADHVVEALSACRVALLYEPRDPRGKALIAELLFRNGQPVEGAREFEEAFALTAEPASLLFGHGAFLMAEHYHAEAVNVFARLRDLFPEEAAAHANYGAACFELGKMPDAAQALEKALQIGQPNAETLNNAGLVRMAMGDLKGAKDAFRDALTLAPDNQGIRNNLGTALVQTGYYGDAAILFDAIVAENGTEANKARFNLATVQLMQGDYKQGWANFEARLDISGRNGSRSSVSPWNGQPTTAPIRIFAEQGLGDVLQFMRFLPEAAERAPLVIDMPEAVHELLYAMPQLRPSLLSGRVRFNGNTSSACALLSLPHVLGVRAIDAEPYISIEEAPIPGRVGLFWAGNPSYRFDIRRSIPVTQLRPVLDVKGLEFVSLQQGRSGANLSLPAAGEGTLGETAREMKRCSLVVGVDTALAHLAGAIGTPLWLMDRYGGDWRWQGPAWYNDVRIFRASTSFPPQEVWGQVIEEIAACLQSRSGGNGF